MEMSGTDSQRTQPDVHDQTRQKNSGTIASLELIRGLASLDVFLWHVLNDNIGFVHIPGLYRAVAWARESVIVFFVLSGYVIALSQQRKHRDAPRFFKARVKRILPIYLVALAVALLVTAALHASCTPWQVVGHLLFLQSYEGHLVPPLQINGTLWSLGTEFEFYILFTLILICRKPGLLWLWWWLSIAGMLIRYFGYFGSGAQGLLLEFLGLSPCWLLGYFAAGFRDTRSFSFLQSVALFVMIPMVSWANFGAPIYGADGFDDLKCFFLALLIVPLIHALAVRQLYPGARPVRNGWGVVIITYICLAVYALTHPMASMTMMMIYAIAPLIIFLMVYGCSGRGMTGIFHSEAFRRTAIFMGGASYALYAIHTPLMFWVEHVISNRTLQFPFLVLLVAGSVLLLEFVLQPWAASWIDRLWKIGRDDKIRND